MLYALLRSAKIVKCGSDSKRGNSISVLTYRYGRLEICPCYLGLSCPPLVTLDTVPGSPSLRVILNAKREGSSDRTYCLCHPGHCSGITFLSLHFVHDSATQPCQSASCLMRHSSCLSFPAPTGNLPIFWKTLAFLQEFFYLYIVYYIL